MVTPKKNFPPARACLFDMDGLLLDSEDKYTICTNTVLNKYGKPNIPWSIKAKMQGRPAPAASDVLHKWASLPISRSQYTAEVQALQKEHFPSCSPLPGVPELLKNLSTATVSPPSPFPPDKTEKKNESVQLALATSSHAWTFALKTAHLEESLLHVFPPSRRVLGDDRRIGPGRGKPSPDIYILALADVNATLNEHEEKIRPDECLVFEDSVPGVEAGRRAGMRVVWCPHPELLGEFKGREDLVLAGRIGEAGCVDMHLVGEVGDGWAEYLETLEAFPYERYGFVVR
ncbi:haloacid dehalogenase-like hydrolase [Diplocarpon rosae]|nr:haloacid dehalogenase-like hydrolase [Diplocarpon rosae]